MPPERRMTEAELRRKTNKPIMEKKRRERINKCLEDLKSIVLTAISEDSRPNKLEKADILEMTVRYLKSMQNGRPLSVDLLSRELNQSEEADAAKNKQSTEQKGYTQCVKDVTTFLINSEDISANFRTKLLGHLANRCDPALNKDGLKQRVAAPRNCREQNRTTAQQQAAHRYISELGLRRDAQWVTATGSADPSLSHSSSFSTFRPSKPHRNNIVESLPFDSPALRSSRYSLVPASPVSNSSTSPTIVCRSIPSPTLSSASQRSEDSVGDLTSDSPGSIVQPSSNNDRDLLSPAPSSDDRKWWRSTADHRQLHHVSSDSGNWSSGSNPPSPLVLTEKRIKPDLGTATSVLNRVSTLQTAPVLRTEMWRPWRL